MTTNFEQATATCEEAKKTFQRMFGGLMDEETKLAETTKRAGGNIRKATNELGDAVKKFESSVNFDRLERCTALLERAAAAMKTLAELEIELDHRFRYVCQDPIQLTIVSALRDHLRHTHGTAEIEEGTATS